MMCGEYYLNSGGIMIIPCKRHLKQLNAEHYLNFGGIMIIPCKRQWKQHEVRVIESLLDSCLLLVNNMWYYWNSFGITLIACTRQ